MTDFPNKEPDDGQVAGKPGKTVLPEPRAPQAWAGGGKEGLRIGTGQATRREPVPAEEVIRLEPEDSLIPRPEQKVTYADLVHDPERRVRTRTGADGWGENRGKVSWKWAVLTLVVVFSFIGIGVHFLSAFGKRGAAAHASEKPVLTIEPRDEETAGGDIAFLLGIKQEACDLFYRFLRAGSPEELQDMVRGGELPADFSFLESWHPPLPVDWQVPVNESRWDVHAGHSPVFGILSGYFPDGSTFQAYITLDDRKPVLDWKATTGYGTASYEELHDGAGDASEIRALVEPAVYFSIGFPESEYQAYLLYLSLEDPPVWGYARRGSEVAEQMKRVFGERVAVQGRGKPKRLLLSLAKKEEVLKNQWLISKIHHTTWLTP